MGEMSHLKLADWLNPPASQFVLIHTAGRACSVTLAGAGKNELPGHWQARESVVAKRNYFWVSGTGSGLTVAVCSEPAW